MHTNLIACQQFAVAATPSPVTTDVEVWQMAAGLEAIAILVLLAGWLSRKDGGR